MLPSGTSSTDAMALARLLIAWRVTNQPLPDRARVSVGDVRLWFGQFSLDWAERILAATEDSHHAAAEPFAHVTENTRAALRQQFARWQRVRARPSAPLTISLPGRLRGCLLCGVDYLQVPPERAHDAEHIDGL